MVSLAGGCCLRIRDDPEIAGVAQCLKRLRKGGFGRGEGFLGERFSMEWGWRWGLAAFVGNLGQGPGKRFVNVIFLSLPHDARPTRTSAF